MPSSSRHRSRSPHHHSSKSSKPHRETSERKKSRKRDNSSSSDSSNPDTRQPGKKVVRFSPNKTTISPSRASQIVTDSRSDKNLSRSDLKNELKKLKSSKKSKKDKKLKKEKKSKKDKKKEKSENSKSRKLKKEKKDKKRIQEKDESSNSSSSSEDEDHDEGGDKHNRSIVDFGPDKKVKKEEHNTVESDKSRERIREDRPREDRGRDERPPREDKTRDDRHRDDRHRDTDRKRDERSRDQSREQNREKRGRDSREPRENTSRDTSRDPSRDNRHVKLSQAPALQDEREVISVKSEPKIVSRKNTPTPPPSKNQSSKLDQKLKLEADTGMTKNLPENHPARINGTHKNKLQNGQKRESNGIPTNGFNGESNGQFNGQFNGQSNSQTSGQSNSQSNSQSISQKSSKTQKSSSKQKEKIDIEELMNDNIVGARRPRPGIKRESGFHDWGSGTINQYEKIKQVGEGTFGQVYKGKCKKNGDIVALKKVRLDKEREGFPITTVREVKVLRELRHQNMIALRDIITETSKDPETGKESVAFYLIFDYMDHDLIGLLDSGMVSFGQNEIMRLMYQLIDALAYCHDRNFMHRDIKPSNILIDNKGTVKVADFGLARLFDDQE